MSLAPAIDRRLLLTATAAHFLNDFHVAFLAPLLPLVVVKFNLSLALAGLLATVLTTSAALSQPVFGIVADRLRRRIFVMLGPALTVLAMGLMGLAPTYALLLALLLIAGTGTASFHPQGASTAGEASGDRRGTGLSLFVAGGELGYSLGPLIVALVVAVRGLEATWLVALPGLGACVLLWRSIPIRRDPPRRPEGNTLTSDLAATFGPLAVLWLVVVLRTIVISGYQTFLPLLLHQRGVQRLRIDEEHAAFERAVGPPLQSFPACEIDEERRHRFRLERHPKRFAPAVELVPHALQLSRRQIAGVDQLQHDDHQILMLDRRRRSIAVQLHAAALELPRGGEREQLMKFGPFSRNP